jgi:hypothetical protein
MLLDLPTARRSRPVRTNVGNLGNVGNVGNVRLRAEVIDRRYGETSP